MPSGSACSSMANFPRIWASKGHSQDKRNKSESNLWPCTESFQSHVMELCKELKSVR